MIPATILDEAAAELREAVDFYEARSPGLGADFQVEIERAVGSIRQFPERWRKRKDGTRRYLVHRFPYIIIYVYQKDHIWFLAFAHGKRRPGYWSDRRVEGM